MGIIDKYLGKWGSRKLIVFLIGTVGLFTRFIGEENWVILAGIYIGGLAIAEFITKLKSG